MNPYLISAITAVIVAACFFYYYEVVVPVNREQNQKPDPLQIVWLDFIHANINSSFTHYHCHQCRKLIISFDQRFRKEIPAYLFNDCIESLYNRLDTRYKVIMKEDEGLSVLTSDNIDKLIID